MRSLTAAPEILMPMLTNPESYSTPDPLKGQALENAKKKLQPYLDDTQKRLEETRAAYLAKDRELRREQRRLQNLETRVVPREGQTTGVGPSPTPRATADLESRLSDVERKLDLILKALEKQGREPEKE
jgi:hypothetical protein